MAECQRIAFVQDRSGVGDARVFCLQGISQYKKALKTPYGKTYRRTLIESIVAFRHYERSTRHG